MLERKDDSGLSVFASKGVKSVCLLGVCMDWW